MIMQNRISFTKTVIILMLAMAVSMMCACFQKAYTAKEEKDQLAHAIAIARVYQKNNAPSIILNENSFNVQEIMGPEGAKLSLTDWVKGPYKDNGQYYMLINTATDEIYSDKDWISVRSYGRQLAEKLYGLGEDEMIVDVFGSRNLPERKDDDSFGERAVVNMLPIGSSEDKQYIEDVFFGDDYKISYRIIVTEKADMDMFRTLDTNALGKDAGIHVYQYPDEVFDGMKYDPDKRVIDNKEDLIAEYDSSKKGSAQDDPDMKYPAPDESFCGKWMGYPDDASGEYHMTLGKPDEAGNWPVEISFVWMDSGNSGDGMYTYSVDVTATANVSDDVMVMNGVYDEGSDRPETERVFTATLEQLDDRMRMVVLDCNCDRIRTGDRFMLTREEQDR